MYTSKHNVTIFTVLYREIYGNSYIERVSYKHKLIYEYLFSQQHSTISKHKMAKRRPLIQFTNNSQNINTLLELLSPIKHIYHPPNEQSITLCCAQVITTPRIPVPIIIYFMKITKYNYLFLHYDHNVVKLMLKVNPSPELIT